MALPAIPVLCEAIGSVVIAEFLLDGKLVHGNAGFHRLCPAGRFPTWHLFTQPRLDELATAQADSSGVVHQGLIAVVDVEGETRTLSGTVFCDGDRLLVVAGYDIDEFERISDSLLDLNAQLDSTQRDLVRINRELARREAVIREISLTDALTGVGNRRFLDDRLAAESERGRRYGTALALFMLDIDHFKRVNDTFGHEAGDRVLEETGALLRRHLRQSDCAARLGGEEFVVLMPGSSLADATAVAERLRAELAAQIRSDPSSITASFGVASLRADESGSDLLARADAALYRAKNAGRNRVVADTGSERESPCDASEAAARS